MRWPIRRQILWPFAGVVLLSVAAVTAAASLMAARRGEEETRIHLQKAVDTLTQLSVPYNAVVLEHMRGLSGAHFVACDAQGGVVVSTLGAERELAQLLEQGAATSELKSLGARPTLVVGRSRYFVARIEPRGKAEVRSLYVLYPEESWARARRDAAGPPLVVGGMALLLTSVVAILLAERFSRRLRSVRERVAAIADGDFREIACGSRNDEIQDLVISVNRMTRQLHDMQEAIRQSERSRLLSQLAGGLAHQLRNSVAGARMALQLHQRRCSGATSDRSLEVALRQLAIIETQVRGLLALGKVERRPPTLCPLVDLLTEVELLVQPACEHSGVRLSHDFAEADRLAVLVDVEAVRAALLNLVLNAIEAAGSDGTVSLGARSQGGHVSIEIADSGEGPSSNVAQTLFDPFVSTKAEGVGLGLALARQVASDHGGTLAWARERELTIFRLTLPVAPDRSRPAATIGDDARSRQFSGLGTTR